MQVLELWRYPVKSMRGERLDEAELSRDGIPGDRVVHVQAADGRVVTARTRPGLLGLSAMLGPDGEPLVEGLPWRHPEVAAWVEREAGLGARLVRDDTLDRFDVLPLTVATDGAVAALGIDRRRLRPNIVVSGAEGLVERDWPGRRLRIGDAVVETVRLRPRCVMTTFDPDSLMQDHNVLRRIVRELDGATALDSRVASSGRARVGDAVEVLG